MSLRPELSVGIPEETMRVAKAAFPRGCVLMILRDDLGPIFHDQQFASFFPRSASHTGASQALFLDAVVHQFLSAII
ncbi:hypothetical protein [Mesorhizobium sp. M0019]|uniref:hypothetical protein n=1 Tax=Mesorhizobium sp. M0019 TaxID=2956845 RepID=UPI00333A5736